MKTFAIIVTILAILLNIINIIQISNGTIEPTIEREIANDIIIILFEIGLVMYWIHKAKEE